MLNIYLISAIMVLSVLGVYFLVKEITSLIIKNKYDSCVVLRIYDNADTAENIIRGALTANPSSDIVIIDKSGNIEADYARVHIKRAPEK